MFTFSPSPSVSRVAKKIIRPVVLHRLLTALGVVAWVYVTSLPAQVKRPEVRTPLPPFESNLDRVIVARVGPWTITGTEFQRGYEFGPAFVKRERDSKSRYVNYLINEKLLALDGLRRGLDQWPDVIRQVSEIEGDLATEELYKKDVLGKVRISRRQLAVGIQQSRLHLTVRWIYCRTASEVDGLMQEMRDGASFDTLFARQLTSEVSAADRSMETTQFKVRRSNPLFAGIVDTMKAGQVSLPIHGPDGWYVVKMADTWTNPIETQSDEEKMEKDVRDAMMQQISDSLSDVYVRNLMISVQPTIMREPFNAIQAFLASKFLTADSVRQWGLNDRSGAKTLGDVTNLLPIGQEILVRLTENSFRVVDFLDWYRMRSPYIKMELSSPQRFFQSTEELIWRMVRDRLLQRRAYARGFQRLPSVKRQTQWWKEKMLYTANRNRIAETITDSLPLVRKYYEDHRRNFVDDKGKPQPFDSVRDDVLRQYNADELTAKLLHEIIRLKREYKITVAKDVLNRIPVDEQNNPKAIDVYAVKKGGVYPHTAFPSIDYSWQSWE